MLAVATKLLRERIESPVKAFPILHPAASVPPNPIINPPRNRRGNSAAAGACQRAVPFDHALSQLPNGTPRAMNAPHVIGSTVCSARARRRLRLGPVIDNPQYHPLGAPAIHASVPSAPRIKPVRYQGQSSGDEWGFGRRRNKNPIKTPPPRTTHAALTPRSAGNDAASGRVKVGCVSQRVRKWRRPCSTTNPPTANPSTAVPAPKFPVPTRDQMEVAQPLAHAIPKPNISPPAIAASHVKGTTGTRMS